MSIKRLNHETFLREYNLPESALELTGLQWETLELIYEKHLNRIARLQFTANYIRDCFQQLDAVHSLKVRIKDPEHLIEKIIRKKLEDSTRDITPDNYEDRITDLIGVRVLHLFKEDWDVIHDFIVTTWELKETPIAYVRKGDREEVIDLFRQRSCRVENHKYGYRSVHYLVKSQPSRELNITEVQVRTIFEEGWSEIDHQVRYPYHKDNPVLLTQSRILNGLAGSADEMGSVISGLKKQIDSQQ